MIKRVEEVNKIDFNGLGIYDYTLEVKDTESSFATIEVPSKAKHKLAYSKRSNKYYYVMSGQLCFTIDDKETELRVGDFCIVEIGKKFAYCNNSDSTAKLILVHTPRFCLEDEVFVK